MWQVRLWCEWSFDVVLRSDLRSVAHHWIEHLDSFFLFCFRLHLFFGEKLSSCWLFLCYWSAGSSTSHDWGIWSFRVCWIRPCVIFTTAALWRHFFIQKQKFALQVLVCCKETHEINSVNWICWYIWRCQIKTTINVNEILMEPSTTSESL